MSVTSVLASNDTVFVGDAVADEDGLATLANRSFGLVRRRLRCRFTGRDRFGRSRWCRTTASSDVERDQRRVDFEDVAGVAVQGNDRPGVRARELHRGLGGFDIHERLVQGHDVADLDLPGHDLGLGQTFTDVGQEEDLFAQLSNPITRSTASRIRSTVGR